MPMADANLFQSLFKYRPRPYRSPLEDYTTEIIGYLLIKDKKLLEEYLSKILYRRGGQVSVENYKIETQYTTESGRFIDLAIFWTTNLQYHSLFVEHKVWSAPWQGEDENEEFLTQIDEYCKYQETRGSERNYVALVTVYPVRQFSKSENNFCCYLGNFTWGDIADLIREHITSDKNESMLNELQNQFLNFLRSQKMAGFNDFKLDELAAISKFENFNSKRNSVAELIQRLHFLSEEGFSKFNLKKYPIKGDIEMEDIYGVIYHDANTNNPKGISENSMVWVLFGLYNVPEHDKWYPISLYPKDLIPDVSCSVFLWFNTIDQKNEFENRISSLSIEEFSSEKHADGEVNYIALMNRKSLVEFIPLENQEAALIEFIENGYNRISQDERFEKIFNLYAEITRK